MEVPRFSIVVPDARLHDMGVRVGRARCPAEIPGQGTLWWN